MTKKVCRGRISSKFGMRHDPINKLHSYHNGVDIATPTGTEVLAPADGQITDLYENALGGKTLIMHSGKYRFGMCHLSCFGVQVGQEVTRGQLIARTGNTGRTTGAHLHFTVSVDGAFIDPEPFIEL